MERVFVWLKSAAYLFLCAMMLGGLAMTGNAQTNLSPIHLSCETPLDELRETDLEAVCDMLHHEIEKQFPERKVVVSGESNTGAAQGVLATLVVEAFRPAHVKGVLKWKNPATNENYKGPSLQVDGIDGAPLGRLVEKFARDVLRVSQPPWEK